MFGMLRFFLFLLAPERAHHLAASFLRWIGKRPQRATNWRRRHHVEDPRLEVEAFGLRFPSVLGIAAGFDKGDGLAAGLFALGFGSVEVGTITPKAQAGNPLPRLFRLPAHRALINRMGFNNAGAAATRDRYASLGFRPGPLGFNLGKNKDTPAEQAPEDYERVLAALEPLGDYFVVNVSSPNTPGLRDLQAPAALRAILAPVRAATQKPVLLKLAPDLPVEQVLELAALAKEEGVAALILSNTTLDRSQVQGDPKAAEAGGLSGAPLLEKTLSLVARVYLQHGEALPIVGVGGISDGEDAWRVIRAGATLLQAYTGFIYGGPSFVREVEQGLLERLEREGLQSLREVVGLDAAAIAGEAEAQSG